MRDRRCNYFSLFSLLVYGAGLCCGGKMGNGTVGVSKNVIKMSKKKARKVEIEKTAYIEANLKEKLIISLLMVIFTIIVGILLGWFLSVVVK